MTIEDAAERFVARIKSSDPLEIEDALIDFAHAILAEASHATDAKLVGAVFE